LISGTNTAFLLDTLLTTARIRSSQSATSRPFCSFLTGNSAGCPASSHHSSSFCNHVVPQQNQTSQITHVVNPTFVIVLCSNIVAFHWNAAFHNCSLSNWVIGLERFCNWKNRGIGWSIKKKHLCHRFVSRKG
jgi:hypothetical protein